MFRASLHFATFSLHFSTRAPRRAIGPVGVIPTVDGWTVRGLGFMLEARGYPAPSRLLALTRGIVAGFTSSTALFAIALLPFII
jgi:hypothetical protein